MSLPKFTAEASLYRVSEPYYRIATVGSTVFDEVVEPQLQCVKYGADLICAGDGFAGGDFGGDVGFGGNRPDLACNRCLTRCRGNINCRNRCYDTVC